MIYFWTRIGGQKNVAPSCYQKISFFLQSLSQGESCSFTSSCVNDASLVCFRWKFPFSQMEISLCLWFKKKKRENFLSAEAKLSLLEEKEKIKFSLDIPSLLAADGDSHNGLCHSVLTLKWFFRWLLKFLQHLSLASASFCNVIHTLFIVEGELWILLNFEYTPHASNKTKQTKTTQT